MNASSTSRTLYEFNDVENEFTNRVLAELAEYSKYCCETIHKGTNCQTRQMGYWAMIEDVIVGDDEKLDWLRDLYDPRERNANDPERDLMCNCVRDSKGKCIQGQQVTDLEFPYFSFGSGKSDTHTEQILLPKIEFLADVSMADALQSTFYLYSYNSPCSKDIDQGGSCSKNIFKSTYGHFFKNNKKYHTLITGFKNWYIYRNNVKEARDLFCKTINGWKTSTEYKTVDFFNVLKFRKNKGQTAENGVTDIVYYNGLKSGYC